MIFEYPRAVFRIVECSPQNFRYNNPPIPPLVKGGEGGFGGIFQVTAQVENFD